MEKPENKTEKKGLQGKIALIVTVCVMSITIIITIFCLIPVFWGGEVKMDFIGQSLLPLWGTWVGTVFAFYFSKENFEAASQSYQNTIKRLTSEEKIAFIPVNKVMKRDIEFTVLDEETLQKRIKKDFLDNAELKHNRFLFFDANNVVQYVIHRTLFNQFIINQLGGEKSTDELTLHDIINTADLDIRNALKYGYGYGVVSENANLLDVKKIMDLSPNCCDVFVTQNGDKKEPVIGLITNTKIFEKANI